MTEAALKKSGTSHASVQQSQASDPLRSVWVGASAGTGKTKILTDRVLRLMLPRSGLPKESATPPGKVLCLTFTKTAAAEMSNRIYERLSAWSVRSDAELQAELFDLTGEEASLEMKKEARRLFARVLDTPGGLKIMTIHSFCQSVLKRFPVEAGLPPHFELMDEQTAVECLTKCLHGIIDETKEKPDSPLSQAFSQMALLLDSDTLSRLMQEIVSNRSLLAGIFKAHGDEEGQADKTIASLYQHLKLDEGATEESVLSASAKLSAADENSLKKALEALLKGSSTDKKRTTLIQPWLENKSRRVELFDTYCRAYFTNEGDIAKTLATKAVAEIYPDICAVLQKEAERLEVIRQNLRTVRLAKLNAALLTVSASMMGHYARYKRYRGRLDFDDLIIKASELLSEERMVPWVLFKLDEGIDHILVDEAQDTSRSQWRVIERLSEEFFAGQGSRENILRTLFVVGDEKQSIFSFQGADPYEFARMQEFFGLRVKNIQQGWEIFLEYSFRSTQTVLEVVDCVFTRTETRKGVVFNLERPVRHLPFRMGQAGTVELWPLFKTVRKESPPPWQMPTEIVAGDNAASRLADKIAETISGWISKKEMLASKSRPIRAGDILILVQSRTELVELLMRALKSRGVSVAGVDRLTLTEEIAIMDLLALAQFALLPKDDLTLASLLKSPLIGLTEEELYKLSYNREGTLWAAVQKTAPDLASWLQNWVFKAGGVTPYAFFAEVLNTPCFADKVSGRRAFYSRLGFDIQDALDEFLNSCLHYEQSHTPSLQKFIDWFSRGQAQIKREQESAKSDLVRIMTVHAAKGLQAPIVFLPDTVKKPHEGNKGRKRLLWPEDETGVPLWSPRQEFSSPLYALRQQEAHDGQEEEYRRLLYVALTRAEDRLYICGYHGKNPPKDACWYKLVEQAFPITADQKEFTMTGEENLLARIISHPQSTAPEKDRHLHSKDNTARAPLPIWAEQLPADEPLPPQPLAPSRPDDEEPAARGPLATDQRWKFHRGIIVHQILELLPQLPQKKWEKALAQYLALPRLKIPADQQNIFAKEILAVLQHFEFSAIFGEGSRAEVPVVGQAGAKILSGQVDRILVTDTGVLIIDYKTNRPPPKSVKAVPTIYLKQMAAYKAVIHKIYPNHSIKCALLWTDGPILMHLPQDLLDPYTP